MTHAATCWQEHGAMFPEELYCKATHTHIIHVRGSIQDQVIQWGNAKSADQHTFFLFLICREKHHSITIDSGLKTKVIHDNQILHGGVAQCCTDFITNNIFTGVHAKKYKTVRGSFADLHRWMHEARADYIDLHSN